MIKYLLLISILAGCSQDNEEIREPESMVIKTREAIVGGYGIYYMKLQHADCYVYASGGMQCRWKTF